MSHGSSGRRQDTVIVQTIRHRRVDKSETDKESNRKERSRKDITAHNGDKI